MKINKLLINLFGVSLAAWTVGCETIIDVDLPEHEPALVINSIFGTNDTTFVIGVYETIGILEDNDFGYYEDEQRIDGAIVELFEDGSSIGFAIQDDTRDYILKYEPKTEKTYSISVSKNGFTTATSLDLTPEVNESLTIEELSFKEIRDYLYRVDLTYSFEDPIDQNYYQIEVYEEEPYYEYFSDEDTSYYIYLGMRRNTIYYNEEGANLDEFSDNEQSLVISDELFNGKKLTKKINFHYNNYNYYEDTVFNEDRKIYLELRTVSDPYYNYSVSRQNQINANQNPFAEPAPVYNNIENGYGVFAGYGSYLLALDVETD